MKIPTLILSALVATSFMHPVRADQTQPSKFLPAKQGATFVGSSLAGAALGGPLGLAAGALIGAWYGNQLEEADAYDQTSQQLTQTRSQLAESKSQQLVLREELRIVEDENLHYAQLVLDQLELEMMFRTDQAELTGAGQRRLQGLASFLVDNPQIAIRLDGYTDPRGANDYNQALSLARVSHVARMLQELGVDTSRIATYSHGAQQSTAPNGDYDAYALERVVKINLQQDSNRGLAQAH
jgi:outer membrane protein OmpA-like peptidoglycan-associated protein